ncbi:MAG: SRPBCC family protein [Adhaeribacter sp.]
MENDTNWAADGRAFTTKKTFSRETSVRIPIQATPPVIWGLLTDAAGFPRWNSTVIAVTGNIAAGETLRLKSTLDPKRTFKLKVKAFEPEKRLVWGDSQGSRTYTLTPGSGGTVVFAMHEKIGGLMFPLYAKYIPPFDEAFETFAADLKREAENIQNARN